MRHSAARPLRPKRVSLLVAQAMWLWLTISPARAGVITLEGNYWSEPGPTFVPQGDIDLPGVRLWVGSGGIFSMREGAKARLGEVRYGSDGGYSSGVIDGIGTRLELDGTLGRLYVGGNGYGTLTLSGGATLTANHGAQDCGLGGVWCGVSVGSSAGSTGIFTLTGSGTSATFVQGIDVASTYRDVPVNWGKTGGASSGTVEVLNGAHLTSEGANVANSLSYGPSGQGVNETAAGHILISGTNSTWAIAQRGTQTSPVFTLGYGDRSTAALDIRDGGQLLISESGYSYYSALNIGLRGAVATATVSGGGKIALQADTVQSALNIGADGGTGALSMLGGSKLTGGQFVSVGLNGGTGRLQLNGSGTSAQLNANAHVDIGNGGVGALELSGGARIDAGLLNIGIQQGSGVVTLSGAGTVFSASNTEYHRLSLEKGALTVASGALFDTTPNVAGCLNRWCGSMVATQAGDDATLTVTGAGSRVSIHESLNVGAANVTAPPYTDYYNGVPGAITRASVKVLNGGVLESHNAWIGAGSEGPAADGSEQTSVSILLQGTGSRWSISNNSSISDFAAFQTGVTSGQGASTELRILDGAQLILGGAVAVERAGMFLGAHGGSNTAWVSGAQSRISFASPTGLLSVGSEEASASLSFARGARLEGATDVSVGINGGTGALSFDGAGTGVSSSQDRAFYLIGSNGYGRMSITNGAALTLNAENSLLQVGGGWDEPAGSGTLVISGAGSQLALSSATAPTTAHHINPEAVVGLRGSGQVTISNGGLLSLYGADTSTYNDTSLVIGHSIGGDYSAPATGVVTVTGTGSRLAVGGVNAVISIGLTAQANGQLNVLNGGRVDSTRINVADSGGIGRLLVDAATVTLSGQDASLGVGQGAGSVGSVQLRNGSSVTLGNDAGVQLLLGGPNGGIGTLSINSGSAVTLNAGSRQALVQINGASSATLSNSVLSVAGGDVYVGGRSGDSGTLVLQEESSLTAAYVGVGTRHGADGGTATLIVNGSKVTADTLEIGTHGYVGGNGTLVANIINRGVFNPGNSPGTLVVAGDFLNLTGGKLVLEVESNGAGGYNIDHLLFQNGAQVDFSGLKVSFHFLGATDPTAFLNSGLFNIDNFIAYQDNSTLDHGVFASTSFAAESDHYTFSSFTYSVAGGADFSVSAVPEPETYALMLAGLGLIGWRARRKAASAR